MNTIGYSAVFTDGSAAFGDSHSYNFFHSHQSSQYSTNSVSHPTISLPPTQSEIKPKKTSTKEENTKPTITCKSFLEVNHLSYNSVHKIWGMVKIENLKENIQHSRPETLFDFVFVLDLSSAMHEEPKLAFVLATFDYFLSKIEEGHRLCLIKINKRAEMLTEGLMFMTPANKEKTKKAIKGITKLDGESSLSEALCMALNVLKDRPSSEYFRLSSVMLFTDGPSSPNPCALAKELTQISVQNGCTLHTFGIGENHDSRLLQRIAHSSRGGVYHYVDNVEKISVAFTECLTGLLSTVAHNVTVRLVGQDGCRLVNFYTQYPLTELQQVKDYTVSLGSLCCGESRGILFKLSLRKLDAPIKSHGLFKVILNYTDTSSGLDHSHDMLVCCDRGEPLGNCGLTSMPAELDFHINRFTTAAALDEAVKRVFQNDKEGAQKTILKAIQDITESSSYRDKETAEYCENFVSDLQECREALSTPSTLNVGVHYAIACSSMYFLERSSATRHLRGLRGSSSAKPPSAKPKLPLYLSVWQEEEGTAALQHTYNILEGYLEHNVFAEEKESRAIHGPSSVAAAASSSMGVSSNHNNNSSSGGNVSVNGKKMMPYLGPRSPTASSNNFSSNGSGHLGQNHNQHQQHHGGRVNNHNHNNRQSNNSNNNKAEMELEIPKRVSSYMDVVETSQSEHNSRNSESSSDMEVQLGNLVVSSGHQKHNHGHHHHHNHNQPRSHSSGAVFGNENNNLTLFPGSSKSQNSFEWGIGGNQGNEYLGSNCK